MPEEKRVCPTCKGEGYLYDDETFTRSPCNCKVAEYMFKHLGAEIARAETIYSSPLYELAEKNGEPAKLDRTKENLHIKCAWTDLLSHLKLCLWTKGIFFKFRIVTDEKIKTVFVGAESYTQRAKAKRDEMVTYNSLNDLLGKEYDFIILRLGFLGHKNVAAAGAVKEALMIRDVAQKPTWLIEEKNSPFGPGNFTYSDELAEYIDRHYKTVSLSPADDDREYEPRGYAGAYEVHVNAVVGGVEDVSISEPPKAAPEMKPRAHPVSPPKSVINIDEDLAALEGTGRSKWKGKPNKRGGGGSGPL